MLLDVQRGEIAFLDTSAMALRGVLVEAEQIRLHFMKSSILRYNLKSTNVSSASIRLISSRRRHFFSRSTIVLRRASNDWPGSLSWERSLQTVSDTGIRFTVPLPEVCHDHFDVPLFTGVNAS
jgi:hypothetical protein